LVKQRKYPIGEKRLEVVPGPAEEAEGTIHPPQDPPTFGKVIEEYSPAVDEVGLDDIVGQVMKGEWGVGQDRRLRLEKAGHNPNDIQREIVNRANKR